MCVSFQEDEVETVSFLPCFRNDHSIMSRRERRDPPTKPLNDFSSQKCVDLPDPSYSGYSERHELVGPMATHAQIQVCCKGQTNTCKMGETNLGNSLEEHKLSLKDYDVGVARKKSV